MSTELSNALDRWDRDRSRLEWFRNWKPYIQGVVRKQMGDILNPLPAAWIGLEARWRSEGFYVQLQEEADAYADRLLRHIIVHTKLGRWLPHWPKCRHGLPSEHCPTELCRS
jgi:hypothetical protein